MRMKIAALCGITAGMALSLNGALADDLNAAGERVATEHCSRCHVVSDANRMGGIGSTPSFKLLRRMQDWEERYSTFFARNPHPSFVTVEGVSLERALPPNAAPITLTVGQVEALMAYVRAMKVE